MPHQFDCFLEKVTKNIEGHAVDIVCMDLNKAFVEVLHSRVIWTIRSHGIQGKLDN